MGDGNSILINRTAFIEKNLNDLQFKISEEEVQYIQNGIETLVSQIVDDISKEFKDAIKERKQSLFNEAEKAGDKLKEIVSNEKIIKAGSFYEGTKNYFPNEFDFIFLLGTFEATELCALYHFLPITMYTRRVEHYRDIYLDFIDYLFYQFGNKKYYTNHLDNLFGEIYFSHSVEFAGPAVKLQFLYKKPDEDDIKINVDIVPAFKIIDPFLTEDVLNENNVCSIPEFHRFIAETGSYIVIHYGRVSFVETEKRFISTFLHPQHKDVYRLVKHLINGNDQNESLKKLCITNFTIKQFLDISSFTIKTAVIWHHFQCKIDLGNIIHRCSHVCAGEIILDLQKHVSQHCKRHLLSKDELKDSSSRDRSFDEWVLLGSKYLMVLGESLNPGPGMEKKHLDSKTDKNYSQHMLDIFDKLYKKD